jgi:hypothetical protein
MPSPLRLATLLLAAAHLGGGTAHAQGLNLIPGVAELPSDTIGDIAVAAVDLPHPTIYYNPVLVRRYGPLLTRFFLAHEYGHIYLRHSRMRLVEMPDIVRDSLLRVQELEADCFAAGQADQQSRLATEAALRFFSRLGPFRFDSEHPTGAQRAAQLLTCLPGPRPEVVFGRGETGVELGPVSGEPEPVQFEVLASDLEMAKFGSEAVVWVDGQRVGSVSNMSLISPLTVDRFGAGIHSYRLQVEVYQLDSLQQFNSSGSVTGRGQLLLQNGARFRVNWEPGRDPTLVREPPPQTP